MQERDRCCVWSGRLPAGLRFDPATGLITGQLLGLPDSCPVQIQELVNGRIVATQWLNFDIDAFPAGLLGGFEVLLEDTSEAPRDKGRGLECFAGLRGCGAPLVQGAYFSGAESGSGRGFRLVDRSSSVPLT